MCVEVVKEDIFNFLNKILSRDYGLTSAQIKELIQESQIEKSIESYPTEMAHMNPSQIIDFVLD